MNFNSASEHENYKSDKNECNVDGCECSQSPSTSYCDTHEEQDTYLFKECNTCSVPVPYNSNYCKWHGGKNYTDEFSKKLVAFYAQETNATPSKKVTYLDKIQSDALAGMKGAALTKFVDKSRETVISLLNTIGMDSKLIALISDFMKSQFGQIIYEFSISLALDAMANKTEKVNLEQLASVLRQQATHKFTDNALELLLPTLGTLLSAAAEVEEIGTKQMESNSNVNAKVEVSQEQTVNA